MTASDQHVVLLIEDNEDTRIVYSTILRHHGYRTIEAVDGEEGVARAAEVAPDVVILDISLPRMDGWAVAKRLRSEPATATVPMLALTAHASPGDRDRARREGFNGYLAKPCDPAAVLAEVRRLLAT
ncbi:MAG: response regulator [Gemmatimonadaceae bacterium]|nr:response regulator [Gemmatimonadaceae bacterium]